MAKRRRNDELLSDYQEFDKHGKHKSTGTAYNEDGYDYDGYDVDGFHLITGKHRSTGTKYDLNGYDINGYDKHGFDRDGNFKE